MGVSVMQRQVVSRQSGGGTCGQSIDLNVYNLGLHVGSIFIVMFVSAMACSFPLLVVRFPAFKIPHNFLFGVRHFGTGVLIATAFVHLLPTAFVSLTDPCLPAFWNQTYPAMAGAIAMAATFIITIIEMVFSERQSCAFPAEMMSPSLPDEENLRAVTTTDAVGVEPVPCANDTTNPGIARESKNQPINVSSRQHGSKLSMETNRKLLQCILLEAGILFHSVFIGMALAVTIGQDFVVFLIAICFHQMFEGLALGARIVGIDWANHPRGAYQPWLMALAYGCTTPIGQAIGIGMRSAYDPASETGLLVVGIMNAISAGLLIFASLVELLAEDFLSERSWQSIRGQRRIVACLLVFLGAMGMSLVGAWA